MDWLEFLRSSVKAGRRRGSLWVRFFDIVRLIPAAEGRARLWTRLVYGDKVHQITPHTVEDRYPKLFDMAASLAPEATRILSFGCSTGEELTAIRKRFPSTEIVGVEINPRSRRIAAKRVMSDKLACVVGPNGLEGGFDVIFALAVLQREPYKVAEMELGNLGRHYPFNRFDAAVCDLSGRLRPGGLLCVTNAQYPVELSSVSDQFEAVVASPEMMPPLFGTDGRLLGPSIARTIFRKRP
jgi:SAM-dependent methyltransferase